MRRLLLERQQWLLSEVRGKLDEETGADDAHGDEADLANSALNTDLAFDARARESRELQLIAEALKKIEEGTYGLCGECQEPIPLARLEALPFAQYCIGCQEELEREGAFADRGEELRFRD